MTGFRNVYNALLLLIAGATNKELARQVSYLRVENQILRSKLPARIPLLDRERSRIVRFAKNLGSALNELASIVHPDTIRRWIRESDKPPAKKQPVGRRRTHADIEQLIVRLAQENGWGYTRILGELKKLGVQSISRNTVRTILRRHGYDTGPKRGPGTWDEFLKMHAESLWQCDFFSCKALTFRGIRHVFMLTFLNVKTRQVIVSPATYHPNEAWVVEQAESFLEQARERGIPVSLVQRDRDTKFTKSFDATLSKHHAKPIVNAFRAPNTNAYIERFIQSMGQECLDRFIIFGTQHVNHLCQEYLDHYHQERPHQALGNEPPVKPDADRSPKERLTADETTNEQASRVHCRSRLGGLLKSYSRKAA